LLDSAAGFPQPVLEGRSVASAAPGKLDDSVLHEGAFWGSRIPTHKFRSGGTPCAKAAAIRRIRIKITSLVGQDQTITTASSGESTSPYADFDRPRAAEYAIPHHRR